MGTAEQELLTLPAANLEAIRSTDLDCLSFPNHKTGSKAEERMEMMWEALGNGLGEKEQLHVGILALSCRRELRNSCWGTLSSLRMRSHRQGKPLDGKIPSPASKNSPKMLG